MLKKLLVAGVIMSLVAVVLVGVGAATASAQSTMSLCQTVDALVLAGVIAPDKVAAAKAAAGCGAAVVPSTSSYTFTRSLTIGSTGADVTALQSWLISQGYEIPAGATGYFGAQTQAAVKAYQINKAITPATGYFGPITMASVNAHQVGAVVPATPATPATCPAGMTCTPTVACPAGYTCTSNTGSISTTGLEGSFTVKLAANPSTQTNLTNTSAVPAIGFDIKAKDSDIKIDRVNLKVSVLAGGATTLSPSSFVQNIIVMDGSTVLKTVPASQLEKDSGVYHVQISGLGFVVPKDTTKTLTIAVDVDSISNGDSVKAVTIANYNTNAFRGVDGAGLDEYNSDADGAFSRTQTFSVSGASTLTVSDDVSKPLSTNVQLDATDGAKKVLVTSFRLHSTTGDSTVTDVHLTTAGSMTPASIYLYDGSLLLGSMTGAPTLDFTDLTVLVSKDAYKTLTVKADYNATTTAVSTSTISVAVNGVDYDKPDGSSGVTSNSAIPSNVLTLVNSATPVFTLVGTPATPSTQVNQTGSTTQMSAAITYQVAAVGGTLTNSSIAANARWATSSAAAISGGGTAATLNLQITPTTDVNDGNYATVVMSSTLTAPATSGYYGLYITSLAATVGGNAVTQTSGLDNYHTPNAYYLK